MRRSRVPELSALGLVLLVGLLLRISYYREIVQAPDFAAPPADAAYHDYWARALVTGDWTPPAGQTDPMIRSTPFFRPPGYPYFLGAVYLLGGPDFHRARIVQMALGLGGVALAFLLGRAVFSRGVALLFALLTATSWVLIYYEGELQEPVLLTVLVLAFTLVLVRWRERPSAVLAGAAGLLLGLSAVVRPNTLVFVPAVVLWMTWLAGRKGGVRRPVVHALPLLLGAAAGIAPVTVRNLAVSGEPVVISCNAGINFYAGNNETSDGFAPRVPDIAALTGATGWSLFYYPRIVEGVREQTGRRMSYSDVSSYFTDKALRFIRENPGRALRLMARKVLLFWGPVEVSNNKVDQLEWKNSATLHNLPGFPMALSLSVAGIVLLLRDARGRSRRATEGSRALERALDALVLVLLLVGAYSLSYLPFIVAGRFRAAIIPLLLLLGAFGLWRIAEHARARRFGFALAALGGWAVLHTIAQQRFVPYEPDPGAWHVDRGAAYERRGLLAQAADEYRAALRVRPEYPEAHLALGGALVRLGDPNGGIEHYRKVVAANPSLPEPHNMLAVLLTDFGRYAEAIPEYEAALRLGPPSAAISYDLGRACALGGQPQKAITAYREALRLRPDYIEAHVNLSAVLVGQGRLDEAEAAARRALEIDPRFPLAHFYLAKALGARGRTEEALAEYRAALASAPNLLDARYDMGLILERQGLIDPAIGEYRRVVAGNPGHVAAWSALAGALVRKNERAQAIAALRDAVRLNPGDPGVRRELAELEGSRPGSQP